MPRKLFEKGNALGGRVKGKPNSLTTDIKQMVLGALSDVGGQQYLARQAHENPKAFLALVGKVFPSTIIDNSTNNTLQLNMTDVVKKALADSDRMYKELAAIKAGKALAIEAQYTITQPIDTQGECAVPQWSNAHLTPAPELHDMVLHDDSSVMDVDTVTLKGEM